MNLELTTGKAGSVLRPQGELTIYGAVEFRDALMKAMTGAGALDIDLSQTGEIDSAGLQMLVAAAAEASSAGRPLRLVAPSAAVMEALSLVNLAGRFEIVDDVPAPSRKSRAKSKKS